MSVYSVYYNSLEEEYWLEKDGIAVTGNLHDAIGIRDLNRLVKALNTLYEIKDLLPENPKLPLVCQIKELVTKGLR
jgi:hypothetical protein